jgi:hypothetical protein
MGPTRKKEAAPRENTASLMWARPWKPHERNVTSFGKPPTGREKNFENSEMLFMLGARCEPSGCVAARLAEDRRDEEHHDGPLHSPLVGDGAERIEEDALHEEHRGLNADSITKTAAPKTAMSVIMPPTGGEKGSRTQRPSWA